MKKDRIIKQIDGMVASGRLTEEEAARLRATGGGGDFEEAVAAIRVRHAGTKMEVAVDAGEMSRAEADGYLERIRNGEHPTGLRARLSRHRPRSH